jgi:tetratricopeptide (TPR) repeat protein
MFDDEDIEDYYDEEQDRKAAIERYEEMLKTHETAYFDSAEFEYIIDHYTENNQLRRSRQALEMAMEQHPESSVLKIKEARQYLLEGQADNAFQIMQHIERDEDDAPDYFLVLGSCLAVLGESKSALESYFNALPYFDEDEKFDLYNAIAFEYQRLQKYDLALDFYQRALSLALDENNERGNLYQEIRSCYLNQGRRDDAVAFFQRLVDQNPHDSEAWANIGECYQQTEDIEQSIDPFEFALAINPLDIVTNVHLADTYYDLGRYQEAIDTLNEALRQGVEHSAIHSALGESYYALHDIPNAETNFKKAIVLTEENGIAWDGLGHVNFSREDYKTALKYFEKASKLQPWVSQYLYSISTCHLKLGQYDLAMKCLHKIQGMYPQDPDSYYYIADLYGEMDQVDDAIKTILYGLQQTNNDSTLLYLLAYAYFVKGDKPSGLEALDRALDANYEAWPDFIDYDRDLLLDDTDIVNLLEQHRIQHEQDPGNTIS